MALGLWVSDGLNTSFFMSSQLGIFWKDNSLYNLLFLLKQGTKQCLSWQALSAVAMLAYLTDLSLVFDSDARLMNIRYEWSMCNDLTVPVYSSYENRHTDKTVTCVSKIDAFVLLFYLRIFLAYLRCSHRCWQRNIAGIWFDASNHLMSVMINSYCFQPKKIS